MGRRGNARPYAPPPPMVGVVRLLDGIDTDTIGPEGSIASIAGQTDSDDYARRMVQQIYRAFDEDGGSRCFWIARALYQQLIGSWTKADEARFYGWTSKVWFPEWHEGPRLLALERILTDQAKADLARLEPLP